MTRLGSPGVSSRCHPSPFPGFLTKIKYIKKVLLFNYEAPMVIPCGEDIPASVALYPGFDLHDPRIYATNIGCGYIDRLQILQ